MKLFIDKFSNLVKGTISGFDRIVFKGLVLPLMSTSEVMTFCRYKGILYIEDYQKAQKLLNKQLDILFTDMLNDFALRIFPEWSYI